MSLISEHGILLKSCNIKTIADFKDDASDGLDEIKLGKCMMRTRTKLDKELGHWVLEASSEAIETERKEISNVYLMVRYVFG